jgi:molybdopterin converting factor small subunit
VKVRIPSPLRSYTAQLAVVDADGATIGALFDDLDRRYPGLRFRVVDEQGCIRRHMKVFVNDDAVRALDAPLTPGDDVTLMQALSGGT